MPERLRQRTATWLILALVAAGVAAGARPALADEYERDRGAHPVRVVAYLLHPFGVLLDYLLVRPAHWLGHREPFQTIFGHEED